MIDASVCINIDPVDAREMGRRRWRGVSAKERSRLARQAALKRWANATEADRAAAKARAANARAARMKKIAARRLGIDPSALANIDVRLVSHAEFRRRKAGEQRRYWRHLAGSSGSPAQARAEAARVLRATISRPRDRLRAAHASDGGY